MKVQRLLLGLLLGITLAFSTFCSMAGGENPRVIIKGYKFIPQEITIKKGQTLRWENQEKRQYHSVWFEALGEEEPEDYLFPEDTYDRQFNQAGKFPYRCGPHPEMLGTVIVTE